MRRGDYASVGHTQRTIAKFGHGCIVSDYNANGAKTFVYPPDCLQYQTSSCVIERASWLIAK